MLKADRGKFCGSASSTAHRSTWQFPDIFVVTLRRTLQGNDELPAGKGSPERPSLLPADRSTDDVIAGVNVFDVAGQRRRFVAD
jgi:hypothetical protein